MIVNIVEIKTGRVAATIPFGQWNGTREDCFSEAWKHAVSDGTVEDARRSEYICTLASSS